MNNNDKIMFNLKFVSSHIIAYIDFLGTKSILKSNSQNRAIASYRFIYSAIVDTLDKMNEENISGKEKIKYKIFSDNVIFAIEYTETTFIQNAITLLSFVSVFQYLVVSEWGLLLRGGVCIGDLYIDDNFVLGSGLITAYEIENKLSIYPRIVVDNDIIKRFNRLTVFPYCLLENDNLFYLNYLQCTKDNLSKHYRQIFNKSKDIVNPQVKQKFDWVKRYHNKIADRLGDCPVFNDIGPEALFANNANDTINKKSKGKSFSEEFESATKQAIAYGEGNAIVEDKINKKTADTKIINGVSYSKNYFSQVGLYNEDPYIYLYQDKSGTEFVTMSDINIASVRNGSFAIISILRNGEWLLKEWDNDSGEFVDKTSGKFVYDISDKNVYISLSDYKSKIKPILDKYIGKNMN